MVEAQGTSRTKSTKYFCFVAMYWGFDPRFIGSDSKAMMSAYRDADVVRKQEERGMPRIRSNLGKEEIRLSKSSRSNDSSEKAN